MHRLALALIVAVVIVGLTVVLVRGAREQFERAGGIDALKSGATMQKAAFFLLLCLIMYVSVTGAS